MALPDSSTRGGGMVTMGNATSGDVIAGRYRIIRPLATGGLGHVWLAQAYHFGLPDLVALKQCTVPEGLAPEQRRVVRRWALTETRAAARIRHRHVIRAFDVHPDPAGPWLAMEYVPSRSLHQVVAEEGPLPPERVAAIGLALLDGLRAGRETGVLHLDVKPGNVLIGDDGRVLLIDFAPAVTFSGIAALARAQVVLGSPKYVAPERLFRQVSTARSDLWSLGATLYHAVEGRPPFTRPSTAAVLHALGSEQPDPPLLAGPLTPVLTGLLRRDPAARLDHEQAGAMLREVAAPPRRRTIREILTRRWVPATGHQV
ncbi:serine/threonine-protein kinase [Actinoplanes sp. NPDC051851]|uniref:serine/threonine-protein kinase n=1 Tax=Actinoplanes sp. NPDC051851 TaxID=3154753 RepID=UPI00343B679B